MNRAMFPEHLADPGLPRLPDWLARMPADTLEDAAISSGAALALLHQATALPTLPQALWRSRLALVAAAASAGLAGRPEREAAIRDAICLVRPGDQSGPAGEIGLAWQRAVTHPISPAGLRRALPRLSETQLAAWSTSVQGNPLAQATHVLEKCLTEGPRDHLAALILADAALSRALGWDYPISLLGAGFRRRDLCARGTDLRLASYQSLLRSTPTALQMAAELTRRAQRLRTVAPKLRAKEAPRAIKMFLTFDACAPSMLAAFMSDRAARRLCDRLVDLGALRELTGRDTFRLYGL